MTSGRVIGYDHTGTPVVIDGESNFSPFDNEAARSVEVIQVKGKPASVPHQMTVDEAIAQVEASARPATGPLPAWLVTIDPSGQDPDVPFYDGPDFSDFTQQATRPPLLPPSERPTSASLELDEFFEDAAR